MRKFFSFSKLFASEFLGFGQQLFEFGGVHRLEEVTVDAGLLTTLHVGCSAVASDSDEEGVGHSR